MSVAMKIAVATCVVDRLSNFINELSVVRQMLLFRKLPRLHLN